MKTKIMEFLKAVRILDEDFSVSHTSLYLYLGMVICLLQPATVHVVALLTLIFTHTNLKRLSRLNLKKQQDATDLKQAEVEAAAKANDEKQNSRLVALETEVQKLVQANNFKNIGR